MINRNEVLELTQKFYNNKSIYLNDNIIVIDTEKSIVIDNIPNTNNDTLLFYNKDVCFKECKNIIELKDFYGCLTMEDIYKWLIEEKRFKKEPFCKLIDFNNPIELVKALNIDIKGLSIKDLYFYQRGDFKVILNDLIIGNKSFQNKTPIQIYNIINNLIK